MAVNNDLFADAVAVAIDTDGGTFTSPATSNVGYGMEPGEYAPGQRSAWWKYRPRASGSATIDTQLTTVYTDTVLAVWAGPLASVPTTNPLAEDDQSGGNNTSLITLNVTADTTYYIQVTTWGGSYDSTYVLRITGPLTVLTPVAMPPMAMELQVRTGRSETLPIVAPPAEALLEVTATGAVTRKIASPGFAFQASIETPLYTRTRRTLLDPVGGVVPVLRPVFTVGVTRTEGPLTTVTVEVEYAYLTYPMPRLLTQEVHLTAGTNVVRLVAEAPASGVRFPADVRWLARLRIDGKAMDSTPFSTFTVDPLAGDHTAQATWVVTGGLPDPHLWYVTPAAGLPGDLVTVVGQGFSYNRGTIELAGVQMPVQRWTHMPAVGLPAQRTIDATAHHVDPEHDEVVVIVPDAPPPGGPLCVVDAIGTTPPDPSPLPAIFVPPLELVASVNPPVGTVVRPVGPNDSFYTPDELSFPVNGGTATGTLSSNAGYTLEPAVDPSPPFMGYRSAWWAVNVPAGEWQVTFDASNSSKPVSIFLLKDNGDGTVSMRGVAPGPNNAGPVISTIFMPTAPERYIIRIAATDDVDAAYEVRVFVTKGLPPPPMLPGGS